MQRLRHYDQKNDLYNISYFQHQVYYIANIFHYT